MLVIRDLTFRIGDKVLFDGADARVPAGRRVGVVGRNGGGKSTLFRIILGDLTPESGGVQTPSAWRVGAVAQEAPAVDTSLVDLVLAADKERAQLMAEAETATDPARIADIQMRLIDIDAHSAEARAASILSGLGFSAADQARPAKSFSGGWRMRVALAGALFDTPDLLLLDEPTNYLDLEGAAWLEGYLARYPHTVLVISHDRGLLNRAVDSILHLDQRRLVYYATPFDAFDATRRARAATQAAEARKVAAARAHMQSFVDRFRAKATKARQAQSRLKALEKMPPITLSSEGAVAPFTFAEPDALSPPLIALEQASAGYGDHMVLSRLDLRIDPDDRIALLGANGQGKSTLSKLLAGRMTPKTGGRVVSGKLRIGFFAQHQLEELDPQATPTAHLARRLPDAPPARLRTRLGAVGLTGATAETVVGELSGGQRARLAMALVALDAPHLLILDEPTNHLDIESREALVEGLNAFPGAIVLVSHDADLVARVADRLWLVSDGRVAPYPEDIERYRADVIAGRVGSSAGGAQETPKSAAKPTRAKGAAPDSPRRALAPLRADLAKAEARLDKLEEMKRKVEAALADPALYEDGADRLETLGRKRAEIMDGLQRAEALWVQAAEALEAAEAEAPRR